MPLSWRDAIIASGKRCRTASPEYRVVAYLCRDLTFVSGTDLLVMGLFLLVWFYCPKVYLGPGIVRPHTFSPWFYRGSATRS